MDPFRVAGGSPGWQVAGDTLQVPGLGHRVSGSGVRVQVQEPGDFGSCDRLPLPQPLPLTLIRLGPLPS